MNAYLTSAAGLCKPIHPIGETITIDRGGMWLGPDGPVAIHGRHSWKLGADDFLVMKIEGPVTVHLRSALRADEHGPYAALWLVDGMLLTGLDEVGPLVRFDHGLQAWLGAGGQLWEQIIFRAV